MSKSASKTTESSSPVAAASPVKSAPASGADSSVKCSTMADSHSTPEKNVSSVSTADAAAAGLDNGSVVCQTTN